MGAQASGIRLLRGAPTDDEVAAVVAVLTTLAAAGATASGAARDGTDGQVSGRPNGVAGGSAAAPGRARRHVTVRCATRSRPAPGRRRG